MTGAGWNQLRPIQVIRVPTRRRHEFKQLFGKLGRAERQCVHLAGLRVDDCADRRENRRVDGALARTVDRCK